MKFNVFGGPSRLLSVLPLMLELAFLNISRPCDILTDKHGHYIPQVLDTCNTSFAIIIQLVLDMLDDSDLVNYSFIFFLDFYKYYDQHAIC